MDFLLPDLVWINWIELDFQDLDKLVFRNWTLVVFRIWIRLLDLDSSGFSGSGLSVGSRFRLDFQDLDLDVWIWIRLLSLGYWRRS